MYSTLWYQYVRLLTIKYSISEEIIVIGEKMKIQRIKKSITEKEYKKLMAYTRGVKERKRLIIVENVERFD